MNSTHTLCFNRAPDLYDTATEKPATAQAVSPAPGTGLDTVGTQQTCLELDSAAIYYSVLNWTCAMSEGLEVNDERLFNCIQTSLHRDCIDFVLHGEVRGLQNRRNPVLLIEGL